MSDHVGPGQGPERDQERDQGQLQQGEQGRADRTRFRHLNTRAKWKTAAPSCWVLHHRNRNFHGLFHLLVLDSLLSDHLWHVDNLFLSPEIQSRITEGYLPSPKRIQRLGSPVAICQSPSESYRKKDQDLTLIKHSLPSCCIGIGTSTVCSTC